MTALRYCSLIALMFALGLYGKAFASDSPGDEEHGVAGIGVHCGVDVKGSEDIHEFIVVLSVVDHSPAEKAGVKAGDKILEIDGTKVAGMNFKDAVRHHLRGALGSVVQVTIKRPGEADLRKFDIVRQPVPDDAKPVQPPQ
jgi:C-terminal processing protease CtpA/Prc